MAICSRSAPRPMPGAYWLCPPAIARVRASRRGSGVSKSGKPCPRFTALCSTASWLITLKMVVPTFGSLVSICMLTYLRFGRLNARHRSTARFLALFKARRTGRRQTLGQEVDEGADGGKQAAAAGIQKMQDALGGGPVLQHPFQLAAGNAHGAELLRQEGDAGALQRGIEQRVEIAGDQARLHLHRLSPAGGIDQ